MGEEGKRKVIQLFKVHGNRWKPISEQFQSRSDNFIKNQFFSMIRLGFRRIYGFFDIKKSTAFLQMIKPKTLLEFVNMSFKIADGSIKGINVLEQFIFLPREELANLSIDMLQAAKKLLLFQSKFLVKFYKLKDKSLLGFINNHNSMFDDVIKSNSAYKRNRKVEERTTEEMSSMAIEKADPGIISPQEADPLKIDIKKLWFKEIIDKLRLKSDVLLEEKHQNTIWDLLSLFEGTKRRILKKPENLSQKEVLKISGFLDCFVSKLIDSQPSPLPEENLDKTSNTNNHSMNHFQ